MAKEKFNEPDLIMGAMQLLTIDGLKRFDTEFKWKGELWKFTAYRISKPLDVIRIDLRMIQKKSKPAQGPRKGLARR